VSPGGIFVTVGKLCASRGAQLCCVAFFLVVEKDIEFQISYEFKNQKITFSYLFFSCTVATAQGVLLHITFECSSSTSSNLICSLCLHDSK